MSVYIHVWSTLCRQVRLYLSNHFLHIFSYVIFLFFISDYAIFYVLTLVYLPFHCLQFSRFYFDPGKLVIYCTSVLLMHLDDFGLMLFLQILFM